MRWTDEDTKTADMTQLQKSQNKLLRFLNKSWISDNVNTKIMLEKHNMSAVSQINAQIKITELWKAINDIIPSSRDNGNDFSFPVPFPFLKLNDNCVKSFLSGYPIF